MTDGRIHDLKVAPPFFDDIQMGRKNFEVRKDDRSFQAGDSLNLQEWKDGQFTGRNCFVFVDYVLRGGQFGIKKGYVVMGTTLKE